MRLIPTVIFALACVVIHVLDAEAADPYPAHSELKTYRDLGWRIWLSWGDLKMNEQSASFSNLKGSMRLRYVGPMPSAQVTPNNKGQVYEVMNADEFYAANKDNKIFMCDEPIRWLGLYSGDAGDPTSDLWITTFYRYAYTTAIRTNNTACFQGAYRLY